MGFKVEDGTGKGYNQKVNSNNRAFVNAITETEDLSATDIGNSFNINTGDINIGSGTSPSALLYLKNNEDQNLVIDSVAMGISTNAILATNQIPIMTLIRNPTGGALIGSALAVAQNQNRNFSSSKTLTADVYAGSNTWNVTGGNDIAQFYQGTNGRLFASIGFELGKGDSIAMKVQPNITAGSTTFYGAYICHLKDANEL